MRNAAFLLFSLFLSTCSASGEWPEVCEDCADGEVCLVEADQGECISVPGECGTAFEGECDTTAADDACLQALCGDASSTLECVTQDGVTTRVAACD